MKNNPTRYSSAVGEVWVMATFKVKYCHKIFDLEVVRQLCDALWHEAFVHYKINCQKLAFDSDHVHMIIDMGLYGKPELAKKLKGYVGRHLLGLLPWLKKQKFWGSGLWNPAYDIRSINNMEVYRRYLDKQKYSSTHQQMLTTFQDDPSEASMPPRLLTGGGHPLFDEIIAAIQEVVFCFFHFLYEIVVKIMKVI